MGKKKGERGGGEPEGRRKKRVNFSFPPFFRPPAHGGSRENRKGGEPKEVTWTLNSAPYTLSPFSVPSRWLTTIGKERHGSKKEGTGPPMHVEINIGAIIIERVGKGRNHTQSKIESTFIDTDSD